MKKTKTKSVEFSCHAPKAKAVFVAGTFNDWKPDVMPLHNHMPNSKWVGTLALPPGRHEYKFVVDGQWCCEPGIDEELQGRNDCCPNSFGTLNRVMEVT